MPEDSIIVHGSGRSGLHSQLHVNVVRNAAQVGLLRIMRNSVGH